MSYFTDEALKKFQEMCAAGVDFGETEVYDFVKCLMSNGDVYGIEPGETCEVGKQISDEEAKKKGNVNSRMSKLKRAFIKKMGRDMTSKELAKARNMILKEG